ncbi:MAG: histidinol-phosphate transaminase [Balneolia bacterium]|nr:histidinol-phosphate transaminase [Balneolia bacterium]
MIRIPSHIKELKPYVAGKTIAEVVKEYKPERISKLASNENRLGCSPKANEAALESLGAIMNYPDPACLDLRAKIADKIGVKPENVIAGSGSEGVMQLIIKTFFEPDEHAITASATFIGFVVLINSRGVGLRQVPMTDDYRFDLEAIADAISPKTKMVYLANPNNPTGTYFTKAEFERFMKRVPDDVLVIMDEAYYEFAAGLDDYPNSVEYGFDNVITLRTFSKAYGLAGYRIGYGVAHPDIISTLMKVKLPFEPGLPAQHAAIGALDDDNFLYLTEVMVEKGRNRLYRFLDEHGVTYVKSASNSVMTVFDTEEEAVHFTDEMLKKGVILRRLPAFGLPNCVRITVGLDEEMEHFEQAFEELFSKA